MVRVAGAVPSERRSAVVKSAVIDTPALSLSTMGVDSAAIAKELTSGNRVQMAIRNAERPSNVFYRWSEDNSYWYMYALMDWYKREVSVLSTIVNRTVTELFRHDLDFRPRFALKCEECGEELQGFVTRCPSCGGYQLRRPDPTQKKYFVRPNGKSLLEEANDNGQSLLDVLKSYGESEILCNQAYMLCVTGDIVDESTGKLVRAYPLEFLAQDPKYVQNLYDQTGKPGTKWAFTRDNRSMLINMDTDEDAVNIATEDGKRLYPAYWKIGEDPGATGNYWLYTKEEVYQDHWYSQSMTYGIPIWLDIEDDLLTYHYLEKHFYKRYKFGYVRKMVILPGFSDEDVEDITKAIQDILATNDNSIPIVCTPPQLSGTAEMKAQTLELGTEDGAEALQAKADIRDRLCAHGGVPNLFAGDVEASGGMNNESQQITIFDRYLMDKYNRIDRLCEWILSWYPQITDWELCINRPSKAHTDAKRRMDKMQEAQMMKSLGFDITFADGEFRYSEEPIDQIMRKEQEAMAQQQAMMGQQEIADGGLRPGDGDGPPEKGTARREDEEIGDSKDEVDLSKREADDAME